MLLQDDCAEIKAAAAVGAVPQLWSVKRDSLLILLLGVLVFTCCQAPEFVSINSRYALFAQEMLRNGPSFFPTTYHAPYPDYPASSTFLVYLVSLPFGRVTPFTVVLPTAVVAAAVLVVTYWIGVLHSRKRGIVGVLFALFTAQFLFMSRNVALDQYTSLATVSSFYLVYSSDCLQRRHRLWLLPFAWVFGFAFRGPVGLFVPSAVTCVYYLWNGQFKRLLVAALMAAGTLVLCSGGFLLAAKAQGGTAFLKQVIGAQATSRFGEEGPGFAFYWYDSFVSCAVTYPLAVIIVVSRFSDIARRRTAETCFLGALTLWAFIVLLAMSIPSSRKPRYILPIVPALSLIASSLITDVSLGGLLLWTKRVLLGICAYLPLVGALGVAGLVLFAWLKQPEWRVWPLVTLGLLVPLAIVARKLDRGWRHTPDRDVYFLAVGVASFIVVCVGVADPITYARERTVPFVRQVETLQETSPGTVCFFRVGSDAEAIKFMANLAKPLEPQFVSSIETLWDTPDTHYVIAKESVFRSMSPDEDRPVRLLARGRIGHKDFVVFTPDVQR